MRKLLCTGSKIYLYVFWLLFFYKQLLLPPCPASPPLSLYLAHSFSLCTYDPPTLATPLPACFAGVCKHFHVWKAQTPWTSFVAFFNVGVCLYVCFWICVCVCLSSCCRLVSMSVQVSTSFSASFTPSVGVESVRVWVTVWLIFIDAWACVYACVCNSQRCL